MKHSIGSIHTDRLRWVGDRILIFACLLGQQKKWTRAWVRWSTLILNSDFHQTYIVITLSSTNVHHINISPGRCLVGPVEPHLWRLKKRKQNTFFSETWIQMMTNFSISHKQESINIYSKFQSIPSIPWCYFALSSWAKRSSIENGVINIGNFASGGSLTGLIGIYCGWIKAT